MISNRLSRWTLHFFTGALASFLAAQGLMLAGLTWPARAVSAPGTLIAVHLLAIGWLLLLMLGALFQFVPVITSRPLPSQRLALATLISIAAGLLGMMGGFLGIAGVAPRLALLLPSGGTAVIFGVLLACWNLGVPLLRTRPLALPGRMVLTGLVFLTATVLLGLSFALALAVPALTPHLAPLLSGLGAHALAGLGGGFTLTAMGVTYKLLPMFMLAPEERGVAGECVHVLGAAGFALVIASDVAQIWFPAEILQLAELVGYAAVALAIGIYLWDVLRIYRTRKRAVIEAHNKAALGAFGFLGLAAVLAVGLLGTSRLHRDAPIVFFLAVFGWLSSLGLTQLYKIIPFLTWLGRYGSSLGRGAVPRVQDLVKESRSYPWFGAYFLGVLLAVVGLRIGLPLFRLGIVLTLLATLGLTLEYWRAWRGRYSNLRPAPAAASFLRDPRG